MDGKEVSPRGADGATGEGEVSGDFEAMTLDMVDPENSVGLICILVRSDVVGGEKQALALAIVSMSAWWSS